MGWIGVKSLEIRRVWKGLRDVGLDARFVLYPSLPLSKRDNSAVSTSVRLLGYKMLAVDGMLIEVSMLHKLLAQVYPHQFH